MEDPVHMVKRARRGLVLHRRADRLATNNTVKAEIGHQPLDRAARDIEALPHHLPPDLPRAVDLEVLGEDAFDRRFELQVPLRPRRQLRGISALGDMIVVGRWGDRQHLADRLDPMRLAVIVNERDHRLNGRSSSAWAK